MLTDNSSGALPVGISFGSAPAGYSSGLADFQRSWLGRALTGTESAEYQDFMRSELSANNQYYRDLALQEHANTFSASEAEKSRAFNASESQRQRRFEERMSSTAYQRAVADMKVAGLNPALLLPHQGGASTPVGVAGTSSPASASSARSGGSNFRGSRSRDDSAQLVGALLHVVGGLLMAL